MIGIKPSNKGKLHAALGVPQGKPIPAKKVAKAAASSNPTLKKEAVFAENAKKWDKPAGGKFAPGKVDRVKTDRGEFGFRK